MGAPSNRLLVDVDPDHGGDDSLKKLFRQHGLFKRAAEVLSGGGGRHFYFTWQGAVPAHLAKGIDLKCDGGYAIMPPSIHPETGNRYKWGGEKGYKAFLKPDGPPKWLVSYIKQKEKVKQKVQSTNGAAAAIGHGNVVASNVVTKGERNNTLAKMAGAMHHHRMAPEAIEAALLVDNQKRFDPPVTADEVRRTVASISKSTAEQ